MSKVSEDLQRKINSLTAMVNDKSTTVGEKSNARNLLTKLKAKLDVENKSNKPFANDFNQRMDDIDKKLDEIERKNNETRAKLEEIFKRHRERMAKLDEGRKKDEEDIDEYEYKPYVYEYKPYDKRFDFTGLFLFGLVIIGALVYFS